ncbi:hypothetical protein LINPERPRIM_LOCUS16825 [Linum perenne]
MVAAGATTTSPPSQVNGSLLLASVISIYCAYVFYKGLSSEPRDYACKLQWTQSVKGGHCRDACSRNAHYSSFGLILAIQKILYASDNDGKAIAEAQAMVASFVHQQKEEEEAAKVVSLTDSQK